MPLTKVARVCENKVMSAKVLKRTSTGAGDTKVVRYVVDTGRAAPKSAKGRAAPAKAKVSAVKKPPAHVGKQPQGTFTVLKSVKPANPYLSTPKEALEVAKRAGIFTPAGKLKPAFN
ncbi:hypothetical protein LMG3410_01462 [Achromobacter aegrifaciens]|uniref:Uncharacterized protein n=2 Tax=Alcaligenaceae TaxID=506 RepID=A0ABM8LL30_9BURK|nr:hypothetical protein LMG3410_01462 [Achromobacter aegrifaciens]CAB3915067.1 hypothetical protein LMG3415_05188 [Achromobacter mucicolens]